MPSTTRGGRWLLVHAALVLSTAASASAGITFDVDSVLDEIDDDTSDGICHSANDHCTLRAAIMQANFASGAGATIYVPAGTYFLIRPVAGANGPENGDLNLTSPASGDPLIWIIGSGEATTIIDANQIDRVLTVGFNRTATLSRMTLRNGFLSVSGTQNGAGIASFGRLTLDHCTVADNELTSSGAQSGGGGIYSSGAVLGGTLLLESSTIRGNVSASKGGGIDSNTPLYLLRSTVDGNSAAGIGGGVASTDALTLFGSTISRNTSLLDGGGIYSLAPSTVIATNSTVALNNSYRNAGGISARNAHIYSSTIAFNGADVDHDENGGIGGGIYAEGAGSFNLANTMVVGNTLFDSPIYDDCFGAFISYRRNVFWQVEAGCSITVNGGDGWDLLNSLDLLGPLQMSGGPTATIALLPGSNAIDDGDSTLGCTGPDGLTLTTDQRGAARSRGVRCDVGAYESGTLFFDGFESADLSAWSEALTLFAGPGQHGELR